MRTKRAHKLLSWVLATAMLLGMLPISALAEEAPHHQVGFDPDGYYYTGVCTFTEGSEVKSEVPDQCPEPDLEPVVPEEPSQEIVVPDAPSEDLNAPSVDLDAPSVDLNAPSVDPVAPTVLLDEPAHEHTDDCYSVTTIEGAWTCERYTYATITLCDPANLVLEASFRVVPEDTQYSEPMPTFTDAEGVAPQSWVDEDGIDLGNPSALTADTVAYALWSVEPPVANALPVDTSAVDFSIVDIRMDGKTTTTSWSDVGRTVVTVSAVLDTPFSPNALVTSPVTVDTKWTYLYNGEAYFSPSAGVWFQIDSFTLRSDGLYATYHNLVNAEKTRKVDSGNLRLRTDWPFSFYDMGSSGLTVMYSLDGKTLQPLSSNETLHLFNNTDALNRVTVTNPDETIRAFTKDQGIMFFVKAGPGFIPFGGSFSDVAGEQKREIFPLSQNGATNGFDTAISEALAQGYTHEFHYTQFDSGWNDGQGRRGFQINTQADENEYTITYVSGVDDSTVTGSTAPQQGKVNTELRISECGFSRVGYDFVGWKDANGKSYAPGDTYYVGQANLTLTATWKAQEATPITVNHYVKNGGTDPNAYKLFKTSPTQASGANLTQGDLLAQADGFVIPMKDTLGLAKEHVGNYYLAFKRAAVATDQNNGLVLNLYYNYIRFYINTNGIPSGHGGGNFTGDIYGMVTPPEGQVWDTKDWYDSPYERRQYAGNVEDKTQDVEKKNDPWTISALDVSAIDKAVNGANLNSGKYGENYTIRWHSVHEGNFIHVDGFVQALEAPPVTYHSNYPNGTGGEVTKELTAVFDETTTLWKHTVLNIDNEGLGMKAPENYFFVGWRDDQGNQYKVNESIIIGSSAHLYAQWSTNPTVTYVVTGDLVPNFSVPGAGSETKPYAPDTQVTIGRGNTTNMHWNNGETQLGSWKFSGWTPNKELSVKEDNTFLMPKESVVFTGSWTFTPDTLAFYVRKDGMIPAGELTTTGDPAPNADFSYTKIGTADMSKALIDAIIAGGSAQNPYYRSLLPVDYSKSVSFETSDFQSITLEGSYKLEDYTWYVVKNVGGDSTWHVDGVPTLSVTYKPGEYGSFADTTYSGLAYGSATPSFNVENTNPVSKEPGYKFNGWSPEVSPTVTANATYTAQWVKTTDFDYTVEYYYQQADGTYLTTTPPNLITRSGTAVGDAVSITDADKVPTDVPGATYVLDATRNDAWSGNIKTPVSDQDPGLVLKVYFKHQFTVSYLPGDFGAFGRQDYPGLSYGDPIPAFNGQTTANGTYAFSGWNGNNVGTVTGDRTYVAQWTYTGGPGPVVPPDPGPGPGPGGEGDGGGGGDTTIPDVNPPQGATPDVTIPDGNIPQGGTPNVNIPDGNVPQGGAPDVDIPDQQPPLGPDDEAVIVDEQLPLGNLPQTGTLSRPTDPTVTMGQLALAASMAAIGLSVVLLRKREDELQ